MSETMTVDVLAETYKALADATRLRMLMLLANGEVCVCEIHDTLRLPQPTASRHLAYLRRVGLVEARRAGTWMHYRMADLDPVRRAIVDTAVHAMGHASGTGKDRQRFEKHAGRQLPVLQVPQLACCTR
jgi:ArsR family transcriptional regulator, arsenate/arsenite/antimonite-responsive transcriptional repressor